MFINFAFLLCEKLLSLSVKLFIFQLMTWKYPSLRRDIDQPTPLRLVYMAMSPDGESIVTGSGFNLEFWRVFNRNDDNNH